MTVVIESVESVKVEAKAQVEGPQTFVREAFLNLMDVHGTKWMIKGEEEGTVIEQGPVWVSFLTNGVVKEDGSAVMGIGVAKKMANEYPTLAGVIGKMIDARNGHRNQVICFNKQAMLTFPHQDHWRNPPTLQRIFASMRQLIMLVDTMPEITAEHPLYVEWPGYQPDPTKSLPKSKVAPELKRAGADDRFVFVAPVAAQGGAASVAFAEL